MRLILIRFGRAERFVWAVTRQQALAVLDYFVRDRLTTFRGPYQDAMVTGEDTLWHSLLSPYLNIGLLQPIEVITAVEGGLHSRQSSAAEQCRRLYSAGYGLARVHAGHLQPYG